MPWFNRSHIFFALRCFLIFLHLKHVLGANWDALLLAPGSLHISVPHLEFLTSPLILFLTGWATLLTSLLAVCGIGGGFATIVSGLTGLPFLLATTELRHAFSFFPTFAVVSVGLMEILNSSAPLILLLCSIYLSAAIHKLTHFSSMKISILNNSGDFFFTGPWENFVGVKFFMLQTLAWSVVPCELLLFFLFISASTRRYAFLLAALFHSLLNIISSGNWSLTPVGVMMLTAYATVASFDSRGKWSTLLKFSLFRSLLIVALLAATFDLALPSENLAHPFLQTIWLYGPLFAIGAVEFFQPHLQFKSNIRWPLIPWITTLVLWGLTPVLVGYKNDNLGWAMFSGAMLELPIYSFQVNGTPCYDIHKLDRVVFERVSPGGQLIYCSFQPNAVSSLHIYFKTFCPNILPTEIKKNENCAPVD